MTELVKISDEAAAIGIYGGVSRIVDGFLWLVMHGNEFLVCSGITNTRDGARENLLANIDRIAKDKYQAFFHPPPRVGGYVMEFFGKADNERRKVEMQ